jgi:glycosyltransferase involved in cell wall biosynthesis
LRVLFFNEGNLGSFILGQAQLEASLRAHSEGVVGLEPRFAGLTPMGRLAQAAVFRSPAALRRAGLDAPTARWHLVQSGRARYALRRELRRWRPDVLHVHSHSVALALGRAMRRIPTALSVDTTIFDWWAMPAWRPDRRFAELELQPVRAVERRRFQDAGVVLAWTDWARRRVLQTAPGANVVEHHPGLDVAHLVPAAQEPRERLRVLFVGGRFAEKGGDDLIAALGDDLGQTVELDLVTPADVAPRQGLRVHRLGPGDPALQRLRQQADVFCLPSLGDAAPWAVLEAMACGIPTVATTVGGIGDLLGHGEGGVLVAPGDRAALRAALHALLGDPARRRALGAAARARCEARYDAARQAPALLDHLRGLARARA